MNKLTMHVYVFLVTFLMALDSFAQTAPNPFAESMSKGTQLNLYLLGLGPVVFVFIGAIICFIVATDEHKTFRHYKKHLWGAFGFGVVVPLTALIFG